MLLREVVARLDGRVARAEDEPVAPGRDGALRGPRRRGERAFEVRRDGERDAHGPGLARGVREDGGLVGRGVDAGVEVDVDGLEPEHGRASVRPEQAEVRAAGRVRRVGRVAHEDHLVAPVREQGQQALALVIEAVARPPDLRRPEQAQIPRLTFVDPEVPDLGRVGRRPARDLRVRQARELRRRRRVRVAPGPERPVEHARRDGVDDAAHDGDGQRGAVERPRDGVAREAVLVERAEREHELRGEGRRDGPGVAAARARADLRAERGDERAFVAREPPLERARDGGPAPVAARLRPPAARVGARPVGRARPTRRVVCVVFAVKTSRTSSRPQDAARDWGWSQERPREA